MPINMFFIVKIIGNLISDLPSKLYRAELLLLKRSRQYNKHYWYVTVICILCYSTDAYWRHSIKTRVEVWKETIQRCATWDRGITTYYNNYNGI
jgi:hypothetical protein